MEISAATFDKLLKQRTQVNILDVREVIEFHTYNIGGVNLPLSRLYDNVDNTGFNKTDEIVVICKAGIRSKTAQAILLQNGYTNVKNLSGGLLAIQRLPQSL
ncbi:rhodanese-like domain-containing protein [Mucilaginibacter auburnensis]|uniref:Rhodanese-related sulfurtransferase n=1 Tax=Mucilaginibacter auburnensis TaxID=1457233 RepID=A0A2H9VL39_9SPHI|nr:rhodanese-like domain-containing protein [Mucilaginibacter auburnensis]PJJ79012.1 rhodanese-related sulfurtransferase [Mucilaginibacter auburnensis]